MAVAVGIGPRAARTIEAAFFIDRIQTPDRARNAFAERERGRLKQRVKTGRRLVALARVRNLAIQRVLRLDWPVGNRWRLHRSLGSERLGRIVLLIRRAVLVEITWRSRALVDTGHRKTLSYDKRGATSYTNIIAAGESDCQYRQKSPD
jgi:hypothetical protein